MGSCQSLLSELSMRDRTRRRVNWMALIVAVSVGASIVATAAQGRGAAQAKTRGPGWTARLDAAQRFREQGVTVAEATTLEARFAEYERLFAAPEDQLREGAADVGRGAAVVGCVA
jgi:hypothetical protein